MNKRQLSCAIAQRVGVTTQKAGECVDTLIDIISEEMQRDGRVIILGFGTFYVKQMAGRKGMLPTSFQPIDIPAKRVVKFRVSRYLNYSLERSHK